MTGERWRVRPRFIPALLIRKRKLVKTTKLKDPTYVGDPVNAVRIFNQKEVDEILVLDIARSKAEGPDFDLVEQLATECFMPLAYGGSISTLEHGRVLLRSGVEKLVLGRAGHDDPDFVRRLSGAFGRQCVVMSLDVTKTMLGRYRTTIGGEPSRLGDDPVDAAQAAVRLGAGEILLTAVRQEGTFEGFDRQLIERVASAVEVPVIASGGARTAADLAGAVHAGASAAAAGSMAVFQGPNRGVLIDFPTPKELAHALRAFSTE